MSYNLICNIDYDNMLNNRINERYFPSQELQPNFDPRPVQTKYTYFMSTDERPVPEENLRKYQDFSTKQVFYTGSDKGPVHYALKQVDIDSLLNNRFMGLQRNDRSQYIPSVRSDLYQNKGTLLSKQNKIDKYSLNKPIIKNVDKCNLAPDVFNNSTRSNLKNLK